MPAYRLYNNSDILGMTNSLLCVVHCTALPLLMASQPWLTTMDHTTASPLWTYLDVLFLLLSLWSVLASMRKVGWRLKWQFAIAWILLGSGMLAELCFSLNGWDILVHLGSVSLIITHFQAFKSGHACRK